MDIQETTLPGVGLRHAFTMRGGHQLGVVSYRTGVSIVAVLRGQTAFPAPEPSFSVQAGDTAVVVGTPAGVPNAGQTPGRLTGMAPSATTNQFDRWASSYEDNTLQQHLFVPAHQTTLQLALKLLPHPRRILDIGCGTGRLLRQARQCYPMAELVGVDLAGRMVATASEVTPTKLAVRFVHTRAERLPFSDGVFDLVFATLSLRHWTDLTAGITEVARVLTPSGVVVLADVFRSGRRRRPAARMLRRRRHTLVPAELDAVLAAHRLEIIGCEHTRWFALPDVKVLAVHQPHRAAAKLPTTRDPHRFTP